MSKSESGGFLSSFSPGKLDTLFAITAFFVATVFCAAWIPSFARSAQVSIGALFVAISLLLMASALFDTWFVLSDRSIFFRLLYGVGLNLVLLLIYLVSLWFATKAVPSSNTNEIVKNVLFTFGLFRLLMLVVMSILGGVIRAICRWRIIRQNESLDTTPTRQRITIATIMLLMAVVAAAIAARKPLLNGLGDYIDINFGSMNGLSFHAEELIMFCAAAEIATFVVLFFPIWLSTFSRSARDRLSAFVSLLLGGLALFVVGILGFNATGPDVNSTELIVPGFLVFAVSQLFAVAIGIATSYGFQLAHLTRQELWSPVAPTMRRQGWTGFVLGSIPLVCLGGAFVFTEVPMLIASGSLKAAIGYKGITKQLGVPYDALEDAWQVAGEARRPYVRFVPDENVDANPTIIGDCDPTVLLQHLDAGENSFLEINSATAIGQDVLEAIKAAKQLDALVISAKTVDAETLRDLTDTVPIRHVTLTLRDSVRESHILALGSDAIASVRLSSYGQPIILNDATQAVLGKKTTNSLIAQYVDPRVPRFDRINGLRFLAISQSVVDDGIVSQLSKLELDSVSFKDCQFADSVFDKLAQVPANVIGIQNETRTFDRSDLMRVAIRPRYAGIQIEQGDLDEFFAAKFRRVANANRSAEAETVDVSVKGFDPEEVRTARKVAYDEAWRKLNALPVDEVTEEQLQSLPNANAPIYPFSVVLHALGTREKAIGSIANQLKTNADGEIVELDIAGLPLDPDLAEAIAALPSLRRLRLSHDNDLPGDGYGSLGPTAVATSTAFLKLMDLPQLETLEIPNGVPIGDDVLIEIGELSSLKRLQLPLSDRSWQLKKVAKPEQLDVSLDDYEYDLKAWQARRADVPGYNECEPNFTTIGISDLAKLHQLEYLFVPGYLVDSQLANIVAKLPNLREFHAPFGALTKAELKALAAATNLASCSIGVLQEDFEKLVDLTDGFSQLDELTVTVIADADLQETFTKALTEKLPTTKVSVLVHVKEEPAEHELSR